ncbi:MAG: TIGR00730 family Rossman fold protein [Acidobacteriota bacterium]|nr:TIGR00730 family Rossman fold protein [Acidobacteriota bacterium]MDW3228974.1 TIGR00730 family Rossman fold protein [Acidobacteriota bacterium]MDY0231189.1 TIGR00730 family Rossman fold protein [Candidatus Saccharicenans sp.]
MILKNIAVFCGSAKGQNEIYAKKARELARALAKRNLALIYGGGGIGLMKEVAEEMLSAGGQVIGVIPRNLLERNLALPGLSELLVVEDMPARKATIIRKASGFIALPGGWGTLEEIFEVLTWAQLGYHGKPAAFLNAGGYFDCLMQFMEKAVSEGFLLAEHLKIFTVSQDPEEILSFVENYRPPLILNSIWYLNPEDFDQTEVEK